MGDIELASTLKTKGITDERVLGAMASLSRQEFVPLEETAAATHDAALGIGHGQTISQPFVVAVMTQALGVRPGERVLEVGTGSGYQAAVLARLGVDVWSIERIPQLADEARHRLTRLGFPHVHLKVGDGTRGWPDAAPFDAIIVTAAAPRIPVALIEQLAPGGRLIAPVGPVSASQELVLLEKDEHGSVARVAPFLPVQFVPLIEDSRPARVH
ncbi:MAG: protein-L-isoaspartate(D-aspartate) O-methyltransferase [Myxococcaceae bacterium]